MTSVPIPSVRRGHLTQGCNTEPDWEITGPLSLNLRAERRGNGDGRIYTIEIACTDGSGNESSATTMVTVPHDMGI